MSKKLRDNELFPYSLIFPIKKLIFAYLAIETKTY